MNYLYHMVPEHMRGDTLFPLHALRERYPKAYTEEVSKYTGREHVLDITVPILECRWNDVLHFTAVHPSKVIRALKRAGCTPPTGRWFKLDPRQLDPSKTAVFLYKDLPLERLYTMENFAPFDRRMLRAASAIPQITHDYYKEEITHGRRPFLFRYVPHILYHGNVSTKDLGVIETR